MKYWWPQAEACIATLLAWRLTGDERHAARHRLVRTGRTSTSPIPRGASGSAT